MKIIDFGLNRCDHLDRFEIDMFFQVHPVHTVPEVLLAWEAREANYLAHASTMRSKRAHLSLQLDLPASRNWRIQIQEAINPPDKMTGRDMSLKIEFNSIGFVRPFTTQSVEVRIKRSARI